MSLKYRDYYEILGVPRSAGQEEIRKTYHKLARKFHPDINKSRDAESRFKEIAEAYEVLGDPEKRKKYDELGTNWRTGQDFQPPPGWENVHFEFRGRPESAGGFSIEDLGGFSDFFESLFGGGFRPGAGASFPRDFGIGQRRQGEDHDAAVTISLEDAYHGGRKSISLQTAEVDQHGRVSRQTRTYDVKIPAGIADGTRIRLAGQGGPGDGGGPAGDLYLRVNIAPHPVFRVKGRDLEVDLPVTPWEAALGAKVEAPTMEGTVMVKVPAGARTGDRLRMRGRGLPGGGNDAAGDLLAAIKIVNPPQPTAKERELFGEMARQSSFNPRG